MATLLTRASPMRTRATPQISSLLQDAFVCRRCLHRQTQAREAFKSTRQTAFLSAFKQRSGSTIRRNSSAVAQQGGPSPLGALSQNIAKAQVKAGAKDMPKGKVFPETSSKSVGYWLLASATSVFGIVVFGGLTRLTESGYVPATQHQNTVIPQNLTLIKLTLSACQ